MHKVSAKTESEDKFPRARFCVFEDFTINWHSTATDMRISRRSKPERFSQQKVRPHPCPLPRGEGNHFRISGDVHRLVTLPARSKTAPSPGGERAGVREDGMFR